jgi:hypothetical protein
LARRPPAGGWGEGQVTTGQFEVCIRPVSVQGHCHHEFITISKLNTQIKLSAQFLNVIESVFSGMARAIIHNSDYKSVDEAKAAIDRYFAERNDYFRQPPTRRQKKLGQRA